MTKISIIVPVYNAEKYLDVCLSSLVNQTFRDFEIIVINDGSNDNSEKIIKKFKKRYPEMIKNYSFPNQGISKTRNYGIKKASGKYISFIDSDDYVDVKFLEAMYERISKTKSDICVCDYYTVNEDEEIKEFRLDDFEESNIKSNPQLLLKINSSPWNKLFKKSLFNDLEFENIKYEDLLLIPKILCSAKKIVKLNECLNFYRIREFSETTVVDEKVFDILKILDNLNNYFKKINIFDSCYQEVEYFNIYRLTIYIIQQRYQKNKKIKNQFIDASFDYLNNNFPGWRKNTYYKKRNILKKMIESHKVLSKIYVNLGKR